MTGARTEPQFFVKVVPEGRAGERVDLSEKVLSFVYEDSEHKADKLVLSVDNWDLKNFDDPVWKKGNLLEVSWGYPGDMAPTRRSSSRRSPASRSSPSRATRRPSS